MKMEDLIEALEYYADGKHYYDETPPNMYLVYPYQDNQGRMQVYTGPSSREVVSKVIDRGEVARKALGL